MIYDGVVVGGVYGISLTMCELVFKIGEECLQIKDCKSDVSSQIYYIVIE